MTMKEETIMGNMPKNPFVGAHFVPSDDVLHAHLVEKRQSLAEDKDEDDEEKEKGREGEQA